MRVGEILSVRRLVFRFHFRNPRRKLNFLRKTLDKYFTQSTLPDSQFSFRFQIYFNTFTQSFQYSKYGNAFVFPLSHFVFIFAHAPHDENF